MAGWTDEVAIGVVVNVYVKGGGEEEGSVSSLLRCQYGGSDKRFIFSSLLQSSVARVTVTLM